MNKNYKCLKNSTGITLIMLVVTIILLIIMAGISINLILGDNGIINKAQEAKQAQEKAEIIESIRLDIAAKEAEKLQNTNGINVEELEEIFEKYGTVNKEGEKIKSLTPENKYYEIPYEQIYRGEIKNETMTYTIDCEIRYIPGNSKCYYSVNEGAEWNLISEDNFKLTEVKNDVYLLVCIDMSDLMGGSLQNVYVIEGEIEFEDSEDFVIPEDVYSGISRGFHEIYKLPNGQNHNIYIDFLVMHKQMGYKKSKIKIANIKISKIYY